MYLDIIGDLKITNDHLFLDVGCGDGSTVKDLRDRGIKAFGSDVEFKDGPFIADLVAQKIVKKNWSRDNCAQGHYSI